VCSRSFIATTRDYFVAPLAKGFLLSSKAFVPSNYLYFVAHWGLCLIFSIVKVLSSSLHFVASSPMGSVSCVPYDLSSVANKIQGFAHHVNYNIPTGNYLIKINQYINKNK